jgi:hypothetical protein
VLVGECLQIIIRFFRREVAKKRQGNRGNVENNVKNTRNRSVATSDARAGAAEPREKHERREET